MTSFVVDNKPYTAETKGRNLLEVCLSLGLNIPYFCWHPAFRSVGACRQCAVKVFANERDPKGRIEMSCMIPVTEGMRVSIDDPEAVAFRRKVIEWLMLNHPHDCPVCDEGGECHLQDMTVMTGHVYRQTRFPKRTHRNQHLGPFVNMEMNRCIQCYRCVRFYRDYAGGRDFTVLGWHDHVYFGRHEEGVLESEFSGNLVEVCPTGVFTDRSLKSHYTRKWDLQTAPSICPHCGLGCNTLPGERYGLLRRIMPRYNGAVNGYFLCDRGRYGYEFVNAPHRIRHSLRRRNATLTAISREAALAEAGAILRTGKAIGIGSPRATLESNFALRTLVGPDRFYLGVPDRELGMLRTLVDLMRQSPAPIPSLREVEACDAVLILGEDVTQTAPLLDLAIRQSVLQQPKAAVAGLGIYEWLDECLREAIQDQRGPLFIATPDETKLDLQATATCRIPPSDIARLGHAVAHALDPSRPTVPEFPPASQALAERIAAALKAARQPLVVSGPSLGSEDVLTAAAAVAAALRAVGSDARLVFTAPECNSLGMAMLPGEGLDAATARVDSGEVDAVVILENDLTRRLPPDRVAALLNGVRHVILLDHLEHATARRASLALPAATFAEASGTLVNAEGRAQRTFQVFVPAGDVVSSWRWLGELLPATGRCPVNPWPDLDSILDALVTELPGFSAVADIAPPAGFRLNGRRVPRQSARHSGRTAVTAHLDVHEPKPPEDPDSSLAFSMEGSATNPPGALIPRFWAPQWNSSQAINKFQIEVGGPLQGGDPGRRLIEPAAASVPVTASLPPAFVPRSGEWLILPAWHIFGSEELSVISPGVAERTPAPYLALNPHDASLLKAGAGQPLVVTLDGRTHSLPLVLRPALPDGVALIPAGLPALPGLVLPAWAAVCQEGGRP